MYYETRGGLHIALLPYNPNNERFLYVWLLLQPRIWHLIFPTTWKLINVVLFKTRSVAETL